MRKFFLTLLLPFFLINSASARFADMDDSHIEYEFYNRDITVNEDGTSVELIEVQMNVLDETGRDKIGNYFLTYNHDAKNLEILDAYTIIDGEKIAVTDEMIEDKPYGHNIKGFDSVHRVVVAYPRVEVGSTIYLKYKTQVYKPILKGFFSTNAYWGLGGYWNKSKFTIKSKLPLNYRHNDPYDALNIDFSEEDGVATLTAELKRPICLDVTHEVYSILSSKKALWLITSSIDEHSELISKFAPGYKDVIFSELPEVYEKIVNDAAKITDEVDQLNYVTSSLNEVIRYMGDWRTVEGSYFPRPLKEVLDVGFGDCKDFSASTAAILNRLGYKAYAVLVYRGEGAMIQEHALPSLSYYNHAMVFAISPSGREFFLDPTNFISMADGIFPDVANKEVYILDLENPRASKIPNIDYKNARIELYRDVEFNNNTISVKDGEIKFMGEYALKVTGADLRISRQVFEDSIIDMVSGDVECIEKELEIPDLSSRVVKDVEIGYQYKKIDDTIKTNLGRVFNLSMPDVASVLTDLTDDREGDLYISHPQTMLAKTILRNANNKDIEKLNFKKDLDFMTVERKLSRYDDESVMVEHLIELKRGYIKNEELMKEEVRMLRDALKRERKIGIVLD